MLEVAKKKKICIFNGNLWKALKDLLLLHSGLISSGVCVGSVFGLSAGKIKCELAWKCCGKQRGKANTGQVREYHAE